MDEVDPSQFLAQENGDDYTSDEQPQILASLGLTHISQVQRVNYHNHLDPVTSLANYFSFFLDETNSNQPTVPRHRTIPTWPNRMPCSWPPVRRPTAPFVTCNSRTEPMHVVTNETFTAFVFRRKEPPQSLPSLAIAPKTALAPLWPSQRQNDRSNRRQPSTTLSPKSIAAS